ncbi:MAG: hypothetical protein HY791_19335 [Deltaproteobacteria bacterium]|nr:hypothetical protein [Deltaproteobacteria bacterium]
MSTRSVSVAMLAAWSGVWSGVWAGEAEAGERPTWFMVEVASGVANGGDAGAGPSLLHELSAGVTWKWHGLRFHVLVTAAMRRSSGATAYEGLLVDLSRSDLDLFLAPRLVVPVFGRGRLYAEVGSGFRYMEGRIDRGFELGSLSAVTSVPVIVGAIGGGVRFLPSVSAGLRAELSAPIGSFDPIAHLSGQPSNARAALLGTLGIHF